MREGPVVPVLWLLPPSHQLHVINVAYSVAHCIIYAYVQSQACSSLKRMPNDRLSPSNKKLAICHTSIRNRRKRPIRLHDDLTEGES